MKNSGNFLDTDKRTTMCIILSVKNLRSLKFVTVCEICQLGNPLVVFLIFQKFIVHLLSMKSSEACTSRAKFLFIYLFIFFVAGLS